MTARQGSKRETRRLKPGRGRRKPGPAVALLTILAIVATLGFSILGGCGRYGRPKRPTPEPAAQVRGAVPAVPSSFLAGS